MKPSQLHATAVLVMAAAWGPVQANDAACNARWGAHVGAVTVDFDDRTVERQKGSGVRAGVGFRNCAALSGHSRWELTLSINAVDGAPATSNEQFGVMLDRLRIYQAGAWQPFWQTGAGAVREYTQGTPAWYPALQAGGGVLFDLFERHGAMLRADILIQATWNEDSRSDDSFHHDARLGLGLIIPFRTD